MKTHACLVPDSHEDDLTGAMVMQLRASTVDLRGTVDDVESRVIIFLITGRGCAISYRWSDIKPRLTTVIVEARRLGAIDLTAGHASA